MAELGEGAKNWSKARKRVAAGLTVASIAVAGTIGSGALSNPGKDMLSLSLPKDRDRTGQPLEGHYPQAQLTEPIGRSGKKIDFVFRSRPDSKDGLHYSLKNLEAEGFTFAEASTQLVYGSPFSDPTDDLQEGYAQTLQEKWNLDKTDMKNYWHFRPKGERQDHGLWGKITFKNRSGVDRAVYASFNFLNPIKNPM